MRTIAPHALKVPQKGISVASRKQKARELQKWTCEQISKVTELEWGMAGSDAPIESRGMGQSGCDVRLDSRALELFQFSVECKFQESWNVPGWIKQARRNQIENTDWLLVMKRTNEAPIVVMSADAFFRLLIELRPIQQMSGL